MTTSDMQARVENWVSQPQHNVKYFPPFQIVSQLVEEVGEIAREVSHLHGFKKKKLGEKTDGLEVEIGDALFAIICLANSEGIEISEAFEASMLKRESRDTNRFSAVEPNE